MLEIQHDEVAGVPLCWTDETPAPRTAGVAFRVGFADEAVPTGLLAVTARRLFYFEPEEERDSGGTKHEVFLRAVEEAEAGIGEDGGRLRARVQGEDVVIGAIQPPERAAEAAELVERARAEAAAVGAAE